MARNIDPMASFTVSTTVEQMTDLIDVACNKSRTSGKLDALAHIGGLAAGTISPQQVEMVQREMSEPGPDFDPDYAFNYVMTWENLRASLS